MDKPEDRAEVHAGMVTLLHYAVTNFTNSLFYMPLFGKMINAKRRNDKRPATVEIIVPDEIVKNLNGNYDQRHEFILVAIPRDIRRRLESPIIDPNVREAPRARRR